MRLRIPQPPPSPSPARQEIEVALSDFLICAEMAIAAVAHAWVFSHHEHTYLHSLVAECALV